MIWGMEERSWARPGERGGAAGALEVWLGLGRTTVHPAEDRALWRRWRCARAGMVDPDRRGALLLWWLASAFGWIEPFFWPPIGGTWDRLAKLATEAFATAAVGARWDQRLPGADGGVVGALVGIPLGFAMGLNVVMRGSSSDRGVYAAGAAAGADPADHPLVRHRRAANSRSVSPRCSS